MEKYLVETLRTEIKQFSQSITKTQWVRPGLSISIKTSWRNIFGIQESLLLIGQVSWTSPVLPDPEGWACVRLEALQGLSDLPVFDPIELGEALSNSRALCETPLPPPIALLHAALTSKYVCFGEPLPILAASCLKNSSQVLHEWYKESALIAPFDADMRRLCRRITRAAQVRCAYVLLNRGLLVGGETSAECCSSFARLAQIAQDRLPAEEPAEEALSPGDKLELPKIRYQISSQRGRPLVLHLDDSAEIREFIEFGSRRTGASIRAAGSEPLRPHRHPGARPGWRIRRGGPADRICARHKHALEDRVRSDRGRRFSAAKRRKRRAFSTMASWQSKRLPDWGNTTRWRSRISNLQQNGRLPDGLSCSRSREKWRWSLAQRLELGNPAPSCSCGAAAAWSVSTSIRRSFAHLIIRAIAEWNVISRTKKM